MTANIMKGVHRIADRLLIQKPLDQWRTTTWTRTTSPAHRAQKPVEETRLAFSRRRR